MLDRLFTFLFFIYFIVTAVTCVLIAVVIRIVTQPFDPRLIVLHKFASFWASLYIWGMPAWKVVVVGREKIDQKATYVIVSNHQSLIDILAGYMIYTHFKWVAKAELFKVPFVGWNMMLNRHVKLKRGDRQGIVDMMKAAGAHLEQGSSVYIFPEGTRSTTGEMQPFKSGAFALAKRAQVAILPVAIIGSKDALPKGRLSISGRHIIYVRVLNPIPYETFADEDVKTLTERVHDLIEAAVRAG
ncbi:MAG: lysophospholipid acyltransferase family protein [Rhodothermales bacterium]